MAAHLSGRSTQEDSYTQIERVMTQRNGVQTSIQTPTACFLQDLCKCQAFTALSHTRPWSAQ